MSKIGNAINSLVYGNSITTVLRIFMGLLFIYSGLFKAINPDNFSKVIILYDVLPENLIPYAAIIFPYLELLTGLLLLVGYKIKASVLVSVIVMIFLITIVSINIHRGKTFACGCFDLEKLGIKEEIGIPVIIRDILFLIILLLIFCARQHVFSIDRKIERKNLGIL